MDIVAILIGAFLLLCGFVVWVFVEIERDATRIRKEQFALPKYRITPAANGRWALDEKEIFHIYGGRYSLMWKPIGIYYSKEEAEKDMIHLTQNGE